MVGHDGVGGVAREGVVEARSALYPQIGFNASIAGEKQSAAMFGLQVLEQLAVIGEVRDIGCDVHGLVMLSRFDVAPVQHEPVPASVNTVSAKTGVMPSASAN